MEVDELSNVLKDRILVLNRTIKKLKQVIAAVIVGAIILVVFCSVKAYHMGEKVEETTSGFKTTMTATVAASRGYGKGYVDAASGRKIRTDQELTMLAVEIAVEAQSVVSKPKP